MTEGELEHVGQCHEYERGSAVGRDAHGERRGEYHQSGKNSHHGVYKGYVHRRTQQLCATAEV